MSREIPVVCPYVETKMQCRQFTKHLEFCAAQKPSIEDHMPLIPPRFAFHRDMFDKKMQETSNIGRDNIRRMDEVHRRRPKTIQIRRHDLNSEFSHLMKKINSKTVYDEDGFTVTENVDDERPAAEAVHLPKMKQSARRGKTIRIEVVRISVNPETNEIVEEMQTVQKNRPLTSIRSSSPQTDKSLEVSKPYSSGLIALNQASERKEEERKRKEEEKKKKEEAKEQKRKEDEQKRKEEEQKRKEEEREQKRKEKEQKRKEKEAEQKRKEEEEEQKRKEEEEQKKKEEEEEQKRKEEEEEQKRKEEEEEQKRKEEEEEQKRIEEEEQKKKEEEKESLGVFEAMVNAGDDSPQKPAETKEDENQENLEKEVQEKNVDSNSTEENKEDETKSQTLEEKDNLGILSKFEEIAKGSDQNQEEEKNNEEEKKVEEENKEEEKKVEEENKEDENVLGIIPKLEEISKRSDQNQEEEALGIIPKLEDISKGFDQNQEEEKKVEEENKEDENKVEEEKKVEKKITLSFIESLENSNQNHNFVDENLKTDITSEGYSTLVQEGLGSRFEETVVNPKDAQHDPNESQEGGKASGYETFDQNEPEEFSDVEEPVRSQAADAITSDQSFPFSHSNDKESELKLGRVFDPVTEGSVSELLLKPPEENTDNAVEQEIASQKPVQEGETQEKPKTETLEQPANFALTQDQVSAAASVINYTHSLPSTSNDLDASEAQQAKSISAEIGGSNRPETTDSNIPAGQSVTEKPNTEILSVASLIQQMSTLDGANKSQGQAANLALTQDQVSAAASFLNSPQSLQATSNDFDDLEVQQDKSVSTDGSKISQGQTPIFTLTQDQVSAAASFNKVQSPSEDVDLSLPSDVEVGSKSHIASPQTSEQSNSNNSAKKVISQETPPLPTDVFYPNIDEKSTLDILQTLQALSPN